MDADGLSTNGVMPFGYYTLRIGKPTEPPAQLPAQRPLPLPLPLPLQ
jgi:hypothetical protein